MAQVWVPDMFSEPGGYWAERSSSPEAAAQKVWVDDMFSEAGGRYVSPTSPEGAAAIRNEPTRITDLYSEQGYTYGPSIAQQEATQQASQQAADQAAAQQQAAAQAEQVRVQAETDRINQGLASAAINPLANAAGGNFLVSPDSKIDPNYDSIDALIQGRTGEALNILDVGSKQQLGLQRAATEAGLAPLRKMDDMRAFNEQQSLLGLNGVQAQQQAIGGIPISDFESEMQRRQQKQLQRGAAARGELGGGATFEAGAQLAGAQQSNIIQNRLSQLEPLVALSRGVRSDMSGQIESGAVRQANIQSGLGTQQGNIRLGAAAPTIQGIQDRAEISGLQGIASANRQASQNNQLANLAGTFATSYFGG